MPPRVVRCPKAQLVRALGPHAWLARLPNGHELAVILPRALATTDLAEGLTVAVDISPADFSQGRFVARAVD